MIKVLLATLALCGLLGATSVTAVAAPVIVDHHAASTVGGATQIDYWYNHHRWHHRRWEHRRWRYWN